MQKLMIELFLMVGGMGLIFKELMSAEPVVIHKLFSLMLAFPAVKSFVIAYGPQLKQLADTADKAIDSEIDNTK